MSLGEMRLYTRRRHEANIHQNETQDQHGDNPGWDLDAGMAPFLFMPPHAPEGFPGYVQPLDEWKKVANWVEHRVRGCGDKIR